MVNQTTKNYFIGLFGNDSIFIEKEDKFTYEKQSDNMKLVVEEKVMKMYNRDNSIEINENDIKRDVKKQLKEDGSRWEGD